MGDVSKAIYNFIEDEIKLFQKDISAAVKSREWFLNRIKTEIEKRQKEPCLHSTQFVNFGSYFKGTKVKNVDEFDILVVIDSNTGVFSSGGRAIGDGLGTADPNHKYDNKYKKSDNSGVSPSKLLNWLQEVVQTITESFGGEAPIRNGQAVTAYIKSKDLKIDLVPAGVFMRKSDGTIFYNIPAGNKDNSWIVTSPREDIELLNTVAKDKDGFRDVVRLCKYIKTAYNFGVSSFAIETAVVDYGENYKWKNDFFLDVTGVLSHISSLFRGGTIPDSYNKENNLVSGVSTLEWYAERIDRIVATLKSMMEVDDQEKVKAKIYNSFKNE